MPKANKTIRLFQRTNRLNLTTERPDLTSARWYSSIRIRQSRGPTLQQQT